MTSMTIRSALKTDAIRIAALSEELGYPAQPEEISQRLEQLLTRSDHLVLVAQSSSGEVVGWTQASEQQVLEVGRYCEILGLIIATNRRGHGIGRLLVQHIKEWAAERGLDQIAVRSNVLRKESHPFYE